jgi:hypothetical protein
MVMISSTTYFRPAIAMIELIFALVIMGIVMMSAPMLISTATSSTYVALQQEGINEAAARVTMIMSYSWDENDTNESYIPPILTVNTGHPDLAEVNPTARRLGTPLTSQRTFILSDTNETDNNASTILGSDGAEPSEDDVDDFIGDISLTLIEAATMDYVENATVNINTAVAYTSDAPAGAAVGWYSSAPIINHTPFTANGAPIGVGPNNTSNIKSIIVTLTSTHADQEALGKTIILRAFSCNIGGYDLKTRF